jgi:hypothetical protein
MPVRRTIIMLVGEARAGRFFSTALSDLNLIKFDVGPLGFSQNDEPGVLTAHNQDVRVTTPPPMRLLEILYPRN